MTARASSDGDEQRGAGAEERPGLDAATEPDGDQRHGDNREGERQTAIPQRPAAIDGTRVSNPCAVSSARGDSFATVRSESATQTIAASTPAAAPITSESARHGAAADPSPRRRPTTSSNHE